MAKFPVGMKIYDNNWYLKHGMEPGQIADFMAEIGVTFVITQSQYLPMQDSAVASSVNDAMRHRYKMLDDLKFRQALKDRNIDYFACMNVGFDGELARKHPEWLPLDQHGQTGEQIDWYVGLPLSNQALIDEKAQKLKEAVEILQPDGVHLGFVRWPGFWETWLPSVKRYELREFCFSTETLNQFCNAKNIDLPICDPVSSATLIFDQHRSTFTDWKCDITHATIEKLKASAHSVAAGIPVAINTIPFTPTEFDGATEQILGQRHATLGSVVDIFEVMAYHQILQRGVQWPSEIAQTIREVSCQTVYCTLQTGPHYTSGMHADAGRSDTVTSTELEQMIDGVLGSQVDGICFFTLADFIAGPESQKMTDIVRAI